MSKAILVIDMPESCNECKIRFKDEYSDWCSCLNPEPNGVWKYVNSGTKPEWCPLKPLPEKKTGFQHAAEYDYASGWNECIDEILGE